MAAPLASVPDKKHEKEKVVDSKKPKVGPGDALKDYDDAETGQIESGVHKPADGNDPGKLTK